MFWLTEQEQNQMPVLHKLNCKHLRQVQYLVYLYTGTKGSFQQLQLALTE